MSGRLVGLAARRRAYSIQAGDTADTGRDLSLPRMCPEIVEGQTGFDKLSPQTTKVPSPKGFLGVQSHRGACPASHGLVAQVP